ncbi:hypothetical protein BH23BAC1_BH23BAC1_01340 [soil metagenome]
MFIDKNLLIAILMILTCNLALAQTSGGEGNVFENQELQFTNVVEIFPNPTSDFLHVTIKESTMSSVRFEMYNIIGNVLRVEYEQVGSNKFKIPVKDLASGYYMLIIKDDDTRYRKAFKFMKI